MAHNTAARVQKHRLALREAGLRPIQIWVPNTHRRGFKSECHRQSRLIRRGQHDNEILAWIEAASSHEDWK
jgi:hypothetical protein